MAQSTNFPDILQGSVWHTTTPERYRLIVDTGFLVPEPNIPDSERWGTACGADSYPFVRSLGGISLFDFRGFDADSYSRKYPNSMWKSFVPSCSVTADAIWIEVCPISLAGGFVSGIEICERWKASRELHRKLMPCIEAAYIGRLPLSLFKRVFLYSAEAKAFEFVT